MTPLSRDQILVEPAGPRLDAWVAEHVMGWQRAEFLGYAAWAGRKNGEEVCYLDHFVPSTGIAAAWAVVESERWNDIDGLRRVYWHLREQAGDDAWLCSIRYLRDDGSLAWAHAIEAATAPLAICRAALLATLEGR